MNKSKCLGNIDLKRFCFPPLELLQDNDETLLKKNRFTYKAKILNSFIKANFPTKIALHLNSEFDSKLVIDNKEATKLVGKGDMLVSHKGGVERGKCAYITSEEINNVCNHVALQSYEDIPYYLPKILILRKRGKDISTIETSKMWSIFKEKYISGLILALVYKSI